MLSLLDFLVYYFAIHLPGYVALLLKTNIKYRGEALSQYWEWDMITVPSWGLIFMYGSAWWDTALLFVSFLFLSLAFSLSLFLDDWKRGRVERVDVAGLVQGLAGLSMFHAAYFLVAPKAADLDVAAFWYFSMYPVLFYVYSAVRLALGRSCPAPLALAAIAYGISAAVENLALLPTAALAVPVAMACKKDGGKAA